MRAFSWFLICFFLLQVAQAGGQALPSTGELHAEIQGLYNFQPHKLNDAQRAEKSALMDQFWAKAKAQREAYVPVLRRELADFSNPPFFLYDGSQLLLSLSNDPADRKIILSAVTHADLLDVQWRDYFLFVHNMAAQGEDTTAAAFNILAQPKFQVFIPQHALTLGQDFCLIYMLLPTDPNFWLQPAIDRLQRETDATAQRSLLLLLWYAQTPNADKALQEFSAQASSPRASKDYASELLHRKDSVGLVGRAAVATTSEASLRQARRERLKAVSDEALDDLDSYTSKIIAKRK